VSRLFSLVPLLLCISVGACGLLKVDEKPSTGIEEETDFGPPLTEIRFEGLGYTKEWVVRRQMISNVGEPYTKESAVDDYRSLDQLKIFSSIHFDVEHGHDGVILTVTVTEVNPYTPSVKIGITDENGVSVGAGASSANLKGTALKASASFNVGGQSGVKVGLNSPWHPRKLPMYDLRFSWQIRDNAADNFREKATEVIAVVQTNLGRNFRVGARFDFFSMGSDVDGVTLSETNRDNVPQLGALVGFDSRDFPRNPDNGLLASVDIHRAGGDANYWRSNLDFRAYWSPLGRQHTFTFFSLTTVTTGEVGVDIPVWDDFHIGGTNTVRGWTFGARVGKNQLINTFEYRYLLLAPKLVQIWFIKMDMGLQLAAFFDNGTAWNEGRRPVDQYIAGGGIGIRLLLPSVNMLRFDMAYGEPANPTFKITLHIGANQKAVAQRLRVR